MSETLNRAINPALLLKIIFIKINFHRGQQIEVVPTKRKPLAREFPRKAQVQDHLSEMDGKAQGLGRRRQKIS